MGKVVKAIVIKVTSPEGKARLAEDIDRKEQLKAAIKTKKPAADIEREFNVKFVTPL